jgi:hypothetical protein
MSYRLLHISTFYPDYFKKFKMMFEKNTNASYEDLLKNILSDGCLWADFYEINFKKIGIDASIIIANADEIQMKWMLEHGKTDVVLELISAISSKNINKIDNIRKLIVTEQIKEVKPDVLFIDDVFTYGGEWLNEIKEDMPFIRVYVGYCGSLYSNDISHMLKPFDFIGCCTQWLKDMLEKDGKKSIIINHAFESTILEKLQKIQIKNEEIVFAGSLFHGTHDEREKLLCSMINANLPVVAYTNRISLGLKGRIKETIKLLLKRTTKEVIQRNITMEPCLRKSIYGMEMYNVFQGSKAVFNSHGGGINIDAGNMRLFETTGVATCLLTDWKPNLNELFEIDKEVVAYKTPEECLEKARWILDHDKEREEIARAGQRRVLKEHTFFHRAQQMNQIIKEVL